VPLCLPNHFSLQEIDIKATANVLTVLTKYYHTQAVVYLIDPVMYVMGCKTKQLHIRDKYVRMLL